MFCPRSKCVEPKKVLILGYGRLGAAFSRLYGVRVDIRGIRRSPLPDLSPEIIVMPIQSEEIVPHLEWADVIIFSPAPGRKEETAYRETYLDNIEFVLGQMKRRVRPSTLFILISSTGVYPRSLEQSWSEWDPIPVETPHQEILLYTEQAVHASGFPYATLRAGGLYGRERGYLYRALKRGKIYTSEMPEHWITSVHEDDLCGVIDRVIKECPSEAIYNVVDDTAMTKRAWAEWIADRLGLPIEQDGPSSPASARRVTNEKLKREMAYRFLYPTVLAFGEAMSWP